MLLLERLKPYGLYALKDNRTFQCRCPAHDDSTPSLSVKVLEDKILVHCFAGCKTENILKALGLSWDALIVSENEKPDFSDLIPEHEVHLLSRGLTIEQIKKAEYKSFVPNSSITTSVRLPRESGIVIPVRNRDGKVYSSSSFLIRILDSASGKRYHWCDKNSPPMHYSILGASNPERIVITEGPLKADVASALSGWLCLGMAGVQSAFVNDICSVINNSSVPVSLAFDMDVFQVGTGLKDVTTTIVKRVLEKVSGKEFSIGFWEGAKGIDDALVAGSTIEWLRPEAFLCQMLQLLSADRIKPVEVDWVYQNLLARGNLTVLEGDPGVGKSMFCMYLAGVLSKNQRVLVFAPEDDLSSVIVPRLIKHNAKLENVFCIDNAFNILEQADYFDTMLSLIKPSLVILDPITAFIKDSNSETFARASLQKIQAISRQHGSAILAIRHLRKTQTKQEYQGLGSIGILAVARVAALCEREGSVITIRAFKNNLSGELSIITGLLEDGVFKGLV